MCEWGRDSLESWGRKKRSLPHNETNEAHSQEEDTNISQEIIVLDFGDERQSTDFLRSDKPGGVASEANFGGKSILNIIISKITLSVCYTFTAKPLLRFQ